jgi:phosphoglucomutase
MSIHPNAGKTADPGQLANIPNLITAYFSGRPDPAVTTQRVSFGTSGHRGTSLADSFNEAHIVAITQAICEYRKANATDGPVFLAKDTHALSEACIRYRA